MCKQNKPIPIDQKDIYAQVEQKISPDGEKGSYSYWLSCYGQYELTEMTADEVKDIIACLTAALNSTGEGGTNE